ncbi:MAG: hypothetical protein IKS46_08765 [Clostridia bacterium]|nr:hypothetical protein [Clostridia bacterium]
MLRSMRKAMLALLTVCMLLTSAAGMAESIHQEIENPAFDMEVTVGYDGMMTYGKTMPVWVRIRNFGDDFEGVLAMNAHINTKEFDRYEKTVVIPAGSAREFELNLAVFSKQNDFTAELVKDGAVVCAANGRPKMVINPSAMLIGVLSTRPQNLKNLDITQENDSLARYEYWNTISLTTDTFPEDTGALKSFGMLVIDDIDPAALSEKQQKALDGWLRSGRILLCGGGANAGRNAAFFNKYTGLCLEEVTTSDTVISGLERMIGRKESNKQVTAATAKYSGAEPIAADAEGQGLIWRSVAGGGRIYTAAFELGDPRLNSESLMHYFWQQMLVNQDQELYSSCIYANLGSRDFSAYFASFPIRVNSMLLPGILVVAGMLILACILWWLLKKKDLRQWMWLVLPVLAVTAMGGMLLLSAGAETNRPLAVITENLVQESDGVIRNYCGISAAVPSYGLHSYSISGENLQIERYDYVDYEEEDDRKNQEPTIMRICYSGDGDSALTAESLTPWQVTELTAESNPHMEGRITGTVWMEEDGLHAEIVNETDQTMSAGKFVTTYGFASVPALAPGEKTDVLMKPGTFKDKQNPEFNDGFMYLENMMLDSVAEAAMGCNTNTDTNPSEEDEKNAHAAMIVNASRMLMRGNPGAAYGTYDSAQFLYCAKPEGREELVLNVDGKPVDKKESTAFLTAAISYQAIGRTGVVFRTAGMDMPEHVDTDDNLMPVETAAHIGSGMYYTSFYYSLNDNPTFKFTLDELQGVHVEKLQVIVNSYYINQTTAYALNARTHAWDEIPMNADIKDPTRYLDEQGRLYIQFRLNGQEMYADISLPLINLEGRLEHAEN